MQLSVNNEHPGATVHGMPIWRRRLGSCRQNRPTAALCGPFDGAGFVPATVSRGQISASGDPRAFRWTAANRLTARDQPPHLVRPAREA